ncbi:hypothetical protein SAMN06265784_11993 [Paraburkholderia susongensis]|uniref:Transposase n=1 Tax=Paraburkholderia susongensis TaxID=1515439 RepID=A0A1X7M610_9BURK|nr:hypothetical protein SAMN06265784_11993 [Paraburkholderia susongensis]
MNRKPGKFFPELRERAVRLVREQRSEHLSMWTAVESISPMICRTPQILLDWVNATTSTVENTMVCTAGRERIKAREREVKELRRTNEIQAGEPVFCLG